MALIRIDRNPSRRRLVTFGLCWLLCFGCLGAGLWRHGDSIVPPAISAAVAILIPMLGVLAPRFLRLFYIGTAYLAFPLGFVVSYLVMGAAYYLVLTPTGLALRLFGHDPLKRRFDSSAKSYWIPRRTPTDLKSYFRQF